MSDMNQSRTSLHNPLILGAPYSSTTSLPGTEHAQPSSHTFGSSTTRLAGGSTSHLPTVPEPATPGVSGAQAAEGPPQIGTALFGLGSSSAERPSGLKQQVSPAPTTAPMETAAPAPSASEGPVATQRSTPHPPALHHTRTAPTTVPVSPVAFAGLGNSSPKAPTNGMSVRSDSSDDRSSSATLNAINNNTAPVPDAVGGLHGAPLPGSKMVDMEKHGLHKDYQASSTGGKTGAHIAARARKQLGLDEKNQPIEANESKDRLANLPPSGYAGRKVERTASGTHFSGITRTTTGSEVVSGYGMVPVTRQPSLPPGVGPFGGAAPSGEDQMMGLRAVRSHEEELERQAEMELKGPDPWAVRFEPGEKANPKNWGVNYRWFLTGVAGLLVLNSTFASSAPSGIITDLERYYGFSQEIAVLTLSLFVAGYCVGPLLWGPLSETYGRRPLFIITFIFYTGFQVGCALSQNTASILVFRFLGGMFAAAPLTNSGAMLADIWDGDHRGQAMSIFSLAPFAGPSIGPIVSGFIGVSGTDFKWVFWILTIFAGVCLVVIVFLVPETYAPILLVNKARRLRKETGDDRWYAPLEKTDKNWKTRVNDILLKPFIMLALEPMLLAITLYMSFVYGVVYLLFEAFPFVFVQIYGFNSGENGLAFLGFFGGGFVCVIFFMTVIEPRYQRHAAKMAPQAPLPEKRLELCILSAWALVIALFWFGWSAYASVHWMSCVLAGGLIGVGVLGMFVSLFNYAIDVYLWSAASALAAMTVMRSLFGAGFPLFAGQMYEKLGVHWASSLLGFLALVMAPIPLVLSKYGPALRKRSKFSPNKMG